MPHRATNVYRFLIFLQKYLLGDLYLFDKLAQAAERKETQMHGQPVIESTKYPYSFEFHFGDPVISRSTIPNATTLLATVDVLGYLTRTGTDFTNTTRNFETFFNYPSIQLHPTEITVLIKVYRHGITHTYFPKLNMEIKYHSSNPMGVMFFKNNRGDLILNVNQLLSVVTTRLNNIIDDPSLYHNMDTQYNYMVQQYENDCRPAINALLARL